jgi:hypothetical protein
MYIYILIKDNNAKPDTVIHIKKPSLGEEVQLGEEGDIMYLFVCIIA